MKMIILGAPGAGKGTQAAKIAENFSIPHISTGDIFRANIKEGTKLGLEAKKYMDKGELVPDELTIGLLMDRLSSNDCREGYILDGYPRNVSQAESLDAALGGHVDVALDIEVPDEVIVRRMSGRRVCPVCGASYHVENIPPKVPGICDECGSELVLRDDDKPETVKNRLTVYHEQTEPLVSYYSDQGVLRKVDGTKEMEDVFSDILKILEE